MSTQPNKSLDGITGPTGECLCSHCQMNAMIDGIQEKEEKDGQKAAPVYQQLAITEAT